MSTTDEYDDVAEVEEFNQWCAEHRVHIPANESHSVDVDITVWDVSDGRIRVSVKRDARERAVAYLTPEQARRLSDLLLASASAAAAADRPS